jgi:methyl-accepting chemotaxis protein
MSSTMTGKTTSSPGDEHVRVSDLRHLLDAMRALSAGDLRRVRSDDEGIVGELAAAYNEVAEHNRHLAGELERVRGEVVGHGRLETRLSAGSSRGVWATSTDAANTIIEALAWPTVDATRVLEAVANGDLTRHVDVHEREKPLQGDPLRLARQINNMVDQLSIFAGEVTRLAREVGTEGR